MNPRLHKFVDLVGAALVSGFAAVLTFIFLNSIDDVPPVKYESVRLVSKTPLKPGAFVTVEYELNRTRACPSDIYGFWVNTETGAAALRLPMVNGGYTPIMDGGKTYWQPVTLLTPNVPGKYQYRADIFHRCTNGNYITKTPPIDVVVE